MLNGTVNRLALHPQQQQQQQLAKLAIQEEEEEVEVEEAEEEQQLKPINKRSVVDVGAGVSFGVTFKAHTMHWAGRGGGGRKRGRQMGRCRGRQGSSCGGKCNCGGRRLIKSVREMQHSKRGAVRLERCK